MAPKLQSPPGAKASAESILAHSRAAPTFNFSPFLLQTYRLGLPADRPACRAYLSGHCPNGTACLDRHVSDLASAAQANGNMGNAKSGGGGGGNFVGGGPNSLVCKHWLRGLCKKGEQCEFLHEYNLRKMPECNFFVRNGFCSNGEECLYLHVDPRSKLPPCPAYERGFCPLGSSCGKKHVRRRICLLYLAGFCPDGPACHAGSHPKWKGDAELQREAQEEQEALLQRNAHLGGSGTGGIPGMGMMDDQPQQQDDEMSLMGRDDRDDQRDRRTRDRDRDDGGRGRHAPRGGKWRGKGDKKWRGRGGH